MRRDPNASVILPRTLTSTNLNQTKPGLATNLPASPPRTEPQTSTNAPRFSVSPNGSTHLSSLTTTNPLGFPRAPQDMLEVQVALERLGISSGSIDGVIGSQTRSALRAYQKQAGLTPTGEWDVATRSELLITSPALTTYTFTTNDFSSLQPLSLSWLGKSKQSALAYESLLELAAEKGHAHPALIRRLNPDLNWTNLAAGAAIRIPDLAAPAFAGKAAWIVIRLVDKTLEAFDSKTNLMLHFPCSIARNVEKRPVGELHVVVIAPNPNYTFDPEVFPESAEAKTISTRLVLAPGPNNPVGVAWIGLDRPGYGMHGTPNPEQVGRTESHGCFRLANWNAELLVKYVYVGQPVRVEP